MNSAVGALALRCSGSKFATVQISAELRKSEGGLYEPIETPLDPLLPTSRSSITLVHISGMFRIMSSVQSRVLLIALEGHQSLSRYSITMYM